MFDQADKLRQLVRETVKEHAVLEPGIPIIAVSGARQGVGASTVAVRLAEELTQLGKRVVLVDANLSRPALATMLEIETHAGLADVLSGARRVAEVLEPVQSGLQLLPGIPNPSEPPDMNIRALRRLQLELRSLIGHADFIVLDAGDGVSPWVERLWNAAQQILLITTTDAAVVRDAYATVKLAPWSDVDGKLRLVVNRCDDPIRAEKIGDGFRSTCRRFLGMKFVGPAVQFANKNYATHRQTVRLLAADVLSHSCAYSHRVTGATTFRRAALSQAAALVARDRIRQV